MGYDTNISWCDSTWNVSTGCTKVSPGCAHCYAEAFAERMRGTAAFPNGFEFMLRPKALAQPSHWRKSRRIFVNSMSDLFHDQMPRDYLNDVFLKLRINSQHTFLILTKRPGNMWEYMDYRIKNNRYPLPNVWLGVSVESQEYAWRIEGLVKTPAFGRFLSCEPLLGLLDLQPWLGDPHHDRCLAWDIPGHSHPSQIDWVIVGGESGPNRRPLNLDWVRSLRDQCIEAGVPFFFKQGSASRPGQDRMLDGRTWEQTPWDAEAKEAQDAASI